MKKRIGAKSSSGDGGNLGDQLIGEQGPPLSMGITIDEVKRAIEKSIVLMQVDTNAENDNDGSFNYDVLGKDIPRLANKICVNDVKMRGVTHWLVSLIDLILNRGMPQIGEEAGVDVHCYYSNLYAQLDQAVKQGGLLEDNEALTRYLKAVFMVDNPVFQLLRSCNQNAISQPVTYYKLILGSKHKLQFQDKDWNVNWDILDHDPYGKKRTITVKHIRTEKYATVDRKAKFSFKWNIIFEYEQIAKSSEETHRAPVSNLDLISQKSYSPVRLKQVTMCYGELEEWNEEYADIRFPSREQTEEFLKSIFEPICIKF